MVMRQSQIMNLATAVEPPEDGIISRAIFNDERLKAVVFGFSAGQELSEHTAAGAAVGQFGDVLKNRQSFPNNGYIEP